MRYLLPSILNIWIIIYDNNEFQKDLKYPKNKYRHNENEISNISVLETIDIIEECRGLEISIFHPDMADERERNP